MNPAVVVLGIILVLVIFLVYYFLFMKKGTKLSNKVDLNQAGNAMISYSTLSYPTSANYSFCLWVYIQELAQPTSLLFQVLDVTGVPKFQLGVTSSAIMNYLLQPSASCATGTVATMETHQVTTNFPLQKWVYFIFSIDNVLVDLYLDGKLVRSQKLLTAPCSMTANCVIRYGVANAYIASFERLANSIDPSTAYSKYMKGNGFSNLLSPYGANVTLTKNDFNLQTLNIF